MAGTESGRGRIAGGELAGRSVAIVGLGESGRAAARLALEKGGKVYVSDIGIDAATRTAARELRSLGADVQVGGHDLARIRAATTVVASPGIPPDAPVLRELRDAGGSWVSEPEFAFRFLAGALIAVTGTNGKTTTAALTAHLLEAAGLRVGLGGNIGAGLGPPASALALRDPPPDWFVLEMSSFQLADIRDFRPGIGILTNLAPDHLDRYPDVETYWADKKNLFRNATGDSRWVLNGEDPRVEALAGGAPGRRCWFTLEGLDEDREGGTIEEGVLVLRMRKAGSAGPRPAEPLLPSADLPVLGRANQANALAAAVAARLAGVDASRIAGGLGSFRPLPHRMEPVAEQDGVLWVNDSKATNLHAVEASLTGVERSVVLLLGGKDKGEDFRALLPHLAVRPVRCVVAFGATRERIVRELTGAGEGSDPAAPPVVGVEGNLEAVVAVARERARPGDMVLLAPGCSSFDMFRSYEERGDLFRALARGAA